jgi:predicted kinase
MPDPAAPRFVAMCGIPFAGKTRLATQLANEMNCSLVSVDLIVTSLGIDLGPDARNQRGWARAIATGFNRSRQLLANGDSVVFDTANHTRRNRDRCRRIAEGSGARFRLVWVDSSFETANRRLLENRTTPVRRDVPDASFRDIVEEFEPPLDEPDVIRVTSGMQLDEIARHLA